MPRFRALAALAVVLTLGACSDSQPPSAPSDGDEELTVQLDQSAGPAAEKETGSEGAGGAQLGTGGRGKANGVTPAVVSCVRNRYHQLCTDIRLGRLRGVDGDAIVTRNNFRTRGQIRINGFLVAFTNRFGPNFVGDDIHARYRGLSFRVFRGDRICHQFPGATPQICGVVR